jgi:digeranylgeranylglycerophospholipid reductase
MSNNMFDVLIIGAGPAGCAAAYYISKTGFKTAVLDVKREIGYPVCCGEAISMRALEMTGLYDCSYIDTEVEGFNVYFPNMKNFYCHSKGYILNRGEFEKFLAYKAEKYGAAFFMGEKALSFSMDDGVHVVKTADSEYRAKVLIGADGPNSAVDAAYFKNISQNVHAMQYKLDKKFFHYDTASTLDFFYDALSPYYFWIFEKQGEINAGGCVSDRKILEQFIAKHIKYENFSFKQLTRGNVPVSGIKEKICGGRTLLIGDAAGLTNPVTMAGIYSALISAMVSAESVKSFFKTGKESALNMYNERIRNYAFASQRVKYVAKHCYKFPESTLNFIGDYFEGRDFRTKDPARFISLAMKNPSIGKDLGPLMVHRQLLRQNKDEMW